MVRVARITGMTPVQVRATEVGDLVAWLKMVDEENLVRRLMGGDKPLHMG